MHKVLISAPYLQNDIELFKEELNQKGINFDVYPIQERMEEHELLQTLPAYNGIICGDDRITSKVIDKSKQLKVIVKWGTGIDSIDKVYANSKNIPVYRTPNAFSEPVSDSVLGYMLITSRSIFESNALMKNGNWAKTSGFCLSEQVLGIIGFGDVGKAVARKANAFGMKILTTDIKPIKNETLNKYNVSQVKIEKLLKEADYVSINCNLNPTSRHLINEKTLALMKSSSFLINTARGPIVKEQDLIKALQNNTIAGAALDVFEEEPLPINSPLRLMNNTILSSHNVNVSPYYWKKVHRNSLNMLYKGLGI